MALDCDRQGRHGPHGGDGDDGDGGSVTRRGLAGRVLPGEDTDVDDGVTDAGGLRLDGVGRRYGLRGPWVLRDVGFTVPGGALVRVTGPNGSGKSTLLRVVAGVDEPTAGRVVRGPAGGTAYVPERFPAALPFSVLTYLAHLGAIRGLAPGAARERVREWLRRLGIEGYAHTPLEELSKGTCQKVAVIQALIARPRLLVLDEAWTGLDTAARATLDDEVRERVGAGATVVFVDHDPRRLAAETTHVYAVATGTLTAVAPVRPPRRPPLAARCASSRAGGERVSPPPTPARAPRRVPPPPTSPWAPPRPLPAGR